MARTSSTLKSLQIRPATAERRADLERLFGERGAVGGCRCMWWRLKRSDFECCGKEERKRGLKALAGSDHPPGLLACEDGEPVGWCSVGPREDYPPLERSRNLRRVDDESVWSVVCFFIAKEHRGRRLQRELLEAAVMYAEGQGAKIVEGYPDGDFMGSRSVFLEAGFRAVLRRSPVRPIMRRHLG